MRFFLARLLSVLSSQSGKPNRGEGDDGSSVELMCEAWSYEPVSSSSYFRVGRFNNAVNSAHQLCPLQIPPDDRRRKRLHSWRNHLRTLRRKAIPHVLILRIISHRMIPARLVPVDEATAGEAHRIAYTIVAGCAVSFQRSPSRLAPFRSKCLCWRGLWWCSAYLLGRSRSL